MPNGFGTPDGFGAFPILFGIVATLVIGIIAFTVIKGIAQWSYNNGQPVQSLAARVVTKRAQTSGGGMAGQNTMNSVSTWYYVTFEMEGGQRQEFGVPGRQYGLLAEGDQGTLTFQGTRYKGFARSA